MSVLINIGQQQRVRLVPSVVRPAVLGEVQAVTADGQCLHLKMDVLLKKLFDGRPQCRPAHKRSAREAAAGLVDDLIGICRTTRIKVAIL